MVSIGFGGGEVIQVDMELNEVLKLLQDALAEHKLFAVEAQNGETVFINAEQVKVLQSSDESEGDASSNGHGAEATEPAEPAHAQ